MASKGEPAATKNSKKQVAGAHGDPRPKKKLKVNDDKMDVDEGPSKAKAKPKKAPKDEGGPPKKKAKKE